MYVMEKTFPRHSLCLNLCLVLKPYRHLLHLQQLENQLHFMVYQGCWSAQDNHRMPANRKIKLS